MLELTDSERVGLVNLVQALVNVVDYIHDSFLSGL